MAERAAPPSLRDRLASTLVAYGIRDVTPDGAAGGWLEKLLAEERPALVRAPAIEVGQHFIYRPDLLVLDRRLGTVGAVVVIDAPKKEAREVEEQVDRAVEEAAYLCHLLLADASAGEGRTRFRVPAVELVLVVPPEPEGLATEVGEALRKLARESDLLHAVGVGLLAERGGETLFGDAPMRRAFPWLLRSTARWLSEPSNATVEPEPDEARGTDREPAAGKGHAAAPPVDRGSRLNERAARQLGLSTGAAAARRSKKGPRPRPDLLHLDGLTLDTYRLADRLELELEPTARVHLVHGHNGSGKSSVVEALELVLTGRVERIEDRIREQHPTEDPDEPESARRRARLYDEVIRHRGATSEARVVVAARALADPTPSAPPSDGASAAQAPEGDGAADPRRVPDGSAGPRPFPERQRARIEWRLEREELPDPLCEPPLVAAGFRLDQNVMDELAHTSDARRAALFLGAFFPEERTLHQRAAALRLEAARALEALGDDLRPQPSPTADPERALQEAGKALLERFAWLRAEHPEEPSLAELREVLPLPLEQLEELVRLAPDLDSELGPWRQELGREQLEDALARLDGALEPLVETLGDTLAALRSAESCFEHLEGWSVVTDAPAVTDVRQALDRWLEACAVADLADRRHGLIQTQRRAAELGWHARGGDRELAAIPKRSPSAADAAKVAKERSDWRDLRDERFDRLERARKSHRQATGADPEAEASPSPVLNPSQVAGLNRTGPWIGAEPEEGGLGDLVRDAVRGSRHVSVPGLESAIGEAGWTEKPLGRVRALLAACEALDALGRPPTWASGSARLVALRTAVLGFEALAQLDREVQQTFLHKITATPGSSLRDSRLDEALNELMALFTPARWAYEDLRLTARSGSAGHVLRLDEEERGESGAVANSGAGETSPDEAPSAGAALRLNTAELNLFTFALFMLCAPRLDNPLRLLVLDDPLQNMDELTVTTLARGLARVLPLLPAGWRLLILFHGEDDLERFRHQLPGAAVYRLPWLRPLRAPGAEPETVRVEAEAAVPTVEPLDLASVIEEKPRAPT